MARVSQYNREMDTTYVYESESYYDPEKKQSRSKRKLIGKIDKETGEIVPTGKRGPRKKKKDQAEGGSTGGRAGQDAAGGSHDSDADQAARIEFLEDKARTQEKELNILRSRIASLEGENDKLRKLDTDVRQMRRENEHMSDILQKIRALANDGE